MEYCCTDLLDLIRNYFEKFTLLDIKLILRQILIATEILHKSWILHRVIIIILNY